MLNIQKHTHSHTQVLYAYVCEENILASLARGVVTVTDISVELLHKYNLSPSRGMRAEEHAKSPQTRAE